MRTNHPNTIHTCHYYLEEMKEVNMCEYKLGMNPKISEVIAALEDVKERLGDVKCEMVYDGMDTDIHFFVSYTGEALVLFMS